ncbi:MAG: DNA-methyltransferase [bacterium]
MRSVQTARHRQVSGQRTDDRPVKTNTLYVGDCLDRMREWPDGCVDLIYLDPPFKSDAKYNILFGKSKDKSKKDDLAQMTAFDDTWEWNTDAEERVDDINSDIAHPAHYAIKGFDALFDGGNGMLAYLSYMAERLAEMKRILRSTGSIFLHCDPAASHYLKIVMDEVFGRKNFRNEIIWCYHGPGSPKMRQFNRKTDSIFWYSKSGTWKFNKDDVRIPYKDPNQTLRRAMSTTDSFTEEQAEENRQRGKVPENWWEIRIAARSRTEYLGYPTQKPIALLERIIKAASDNGDVVLDPFCGCGTTIHAAINLKRKWAGIDISYYAIEVIRRDRLKDITIELDGVPTDLRAAEAFARKDPFEFEKWAVSRIHGLAPNTVQRGDGGIDGRGLILYAEKKDNLCIAQVKSGAPSVDALRAFQGNIVGGRAAVCLFITLRKKNETPTMKKLIAQSGYIEINHRKFHRFVVWSVEEFFNGVEPRIPYLAHPRTRAPLQEDILNPQNRLPAG